MGDQLFLVVLRCFTRCVDILKEAPTIRMLSQRTVLLVREAFNHFTRRNFGIAAVAYNKVSDPIQALFLNKLNDYSQKSKALGGGMVDAGAETEKMLNRELGRLAKANGGTAEQLARFPSFEFKDAPLVK